MAKFIYKAKNDRGQIVTGTVQAGSEIEAEKILFNNKLFATDIMPEQSVNFEKFFQTRISTKDRSVIARELSTMISAGLSLTKAISILAVQAKNDRQKEIFHTIYRDLEGGFSFSTALAKHPEAFDRVFVAIVKSGETTGNLDKVLEQLANSLEQDSDFISKIKASLYYPLFVLAALIGIGSYMLVAVIPKLKDVFEKAGAKLPIATRILIWLSNFMVHYWWAALIVIIIIVYVVRSWIISSVGAKTINRWELEIPWVKNLAIGLYMSRFSRTLEMLVGSGVPLLDALKVVASTMNNRIYEDGISDMALEVEKGVPLSIPINKNAYFPKLLSQMVAVGEQTGQLDKVLDKVAIYYERETGEKIKAISTLFEPILLLIIGAGVAFIVFAVLVPIYSIAQLQ